MINLIRLHVRRGDKITEASFVNISQYMLHVDKWYRNYQLNLDKQGVTNENLIKKVFIATDQASLLAEFKMKLAFQLSCL